MAPKRPAVSESTYQEVLEHGIGGDDFEDCLQKILDEVDA